MPTLPSLDAGHSTDALAPIVTSAEVVVVGSGLAGTATALRLAAQGMDVTLLSPAADLLDLGAGTSSALAQGGIAAAVGADDHPDLHAADTVAAGAGLTHPDVAARVTAAGPAVVADLLDLGTRFDRAPDGALRLGLEGAHGRHRIVHAHGDASGAEILRAVTATALAHPHIQVRCATTVRSLVTRDGRVVGVDAVESTGTPGGTELTSLVSGSSTAHVEYDDSAGSPGIVDILRPVHVETPAVVLATGGIGGLFAHTTNPVTSWGSGLALGLRAGARVRDLELVQFHPTALDVDGDPMALVTEAVRGAGVPLVLDDGTPLPDPLAGRDIVARAVWGALRAGRGVFLDVPGGPHEVRECFARMFPTVHASCRAAGLDPTRDRLPVRPAAHYHMGGLLVDSAGRTDVPGLWAAGEVASTGLHGANRLASNSLLEAVACADVIARDVRASHDVRDAMSRDAIDDRRGTVRDGLTAVPDHVDPATASRAGDRNALRTPETQQRRDVDGRAESTLAPATPDDRTTTGTPPIPARPPTPADRRLLEEAAGLCRDGETLRRAVSSMRTGAESDDARLVATLLLQAALRRTESRGAHQRLDHPRTGPARHTLLDLVDLDVDRMADGLHDPLRPADRSAS